MFKNVTQSYSPSTPRGHKLQNELNQYSTTLHLTHVNIQIIERKCPSFIIRFVQFFFDVIDTSFGAHNHTHSQCWRGHGTSFFSFSLTDKVIWWGFFFCSSCMWFYLIFCQKFMCVCVTQKRTTMWLIAILPQKFWLPLGEVWPFLIVIIQCLCTSDYLMVIVWGEVLHFGHFYFVCFCFYVLFFFDCYIIIIIITVKEENRKWISQMNISRHEKRSFNK